MKLLVPCLGVLLFAGGPARLPQQSKRNEQSHFATSGSTVRPAITGPEDITALVHVVEQLDSPLEILAIDFKGSFLSVANEHETNQLHCTMKIHNRSDQWIRSTSLEVRAATASGGGGTGFEAHRGQWDGLAPGKEMEVHACGGGGSGGALGNHLRILVLVRQVEMDDYFYVPSKLIPFELGVSPVGL
jgi:hypothetical protein